MFAQFHVMKTKEGLKFVAYSHSIVKFHKPTLLRSMPNDNGNNWFCLLYNFSNNQMYMASSDYNYKTMQEWS